MTDKEAREQQRRIEKLVKVWKDRLGLQAWNITHDFKRDRFDEGGAACVAETDADWRYQNALISWSLPVVQGESNDELERGVIHEFTHCLTDQLKRYAMGETDHARADLHQVEQSVTGLTIAIWLTHLDGLRK